MDRRKQSVTTHAGYSKKVMMNERELTLRVFNDYSGNVIAIRTNA